MSYLVASFDARKQRCRIRRFVSGAWGQADGLCAAPSARRRRGGEARAFNHCDHAGASAPPSRVW
eukprot:6214013-Pleurochrysis_carterae.AAC.1